MSPDSLSPHSKSLPVVDLKDFSFRSGVTGKFSISADDFEQLYKHAKGGIVGQKIYTAKDNFEAGRFMEAYEALHSGHSVILTRLEHLTKKGTPEALSLSKEMIEHFENLKLGLLKEEEKRNHVEEMLASKQREDFQTEFLHVLSGEKIFSSWRFL